MPDYFNDEYDIEKAFAAIEQELISSMMRNLDLHRAEEDELGIKWSQWQVVQLEALERYKKENATKFTKTFSNINSSIEAMINAARDAGDTDQEQAILRAIKNGFKARRNPDKGIHGEFFKLNTRKLNALIKATTDDLKKAEQAMLRMANDKYRRIIYNAQVFANTGAGTYAKAVDMATKDFLRAGINCVEYKNGSRHSVKEYAEMAIQTANKRAYLTGEGEKRQEWDISLVILKKRGNACPKCLPFVGKVLIDDVWSGGKPEDGPYPLMSRAIELGLYHPRCLDVHTTYFEGITKPGAKYTKEELAKIEGDYNAGQRKNHAKNQAEKYGRMAEYSLDKDNKRMYKAREQEWKQVTEQYAEQERLSKNIQYAVDTRILESREYADKFAKIVENMDVRRSYLKNAKEILKHRSGQNGEDLYLYNIDNGKWCKSVSGTEAGTPEYTDEIRAFIKTAKAGQLVAFHNHPASMPPSIGDINAALKNRYLKGYILCHNCIIYEYTASKMYIDESIYNSRIAYFKKKGYNEDEAQVETLKVLSELYEFSFKEVK